MNGQETDDIVCQYLMEYTNENSSIFKLLENLKRDIQMEEMDAPIERIQAQIEKCNAEMDNLVNTISETKASSMFLEKINIKMQQLEQELYELKERQAQVEQDTLTADEKKLKMDLLVSCLSSLKNNFNTLTIQDKRMLVKLLIQKITWDGENLHIFIYGE